jgi:aminoglycoside phosphotransferase (APT) family kinase protein
LVPSMEERAANPAGGEASELQLRAWVERAAKGRITLWQSISGGNRCRSWAVDIVSNDGTRSEVYLRYQPPRPPSAEPYTVWREAEFYKALQGSGVPAPELIAVNPDYPAIITERAPGKADYRRLSSLDEKEAIATDFARALARLHAIPVDNLDLPDYAGGRIPDCVRLEIAIWRAMYEEASPTDPLIELALDWLEQNIPQTDDDPVLVHGDAGPGNFLFENGHMTALLDWELAHVGDPMEDLAWFSMRCVMEPVPDFSETIRHYEKASRRQVDVGRILYHRVFVSTRVVIIRHRNVTGEPGNSIVSKALNRRLLIDALAAANGIALASRLPMNACPTPYTHLYDAVLHDLRHKIADRSEDASIVATAKNAAKVLKYLRETDRLSAIAERERLDDLARLLDNHPTNLEAGDASLREAITQHKISFEALIRFFADDVARDAHIAALSSGGLAERKFPEIQESSSR